MATLPVSRAAIDVRREVWYQAGMPYMIDGHNLIGAMPGHRLEDPDDEANLIARLQKFCAASGKAATVYFDRRSPGRADPPRIGRLTVHFIAESSSADQAIRAHLRRLRGDARNWTVVSSDGEVAAAARRAGAKALTSASFLRRLEGPTPQGRGSEKPDSPLSNEENAALLRDFEASRPSRRSKPA